MVKKKDPLSELRRIERESKELERDDFDPTRDIPERVSWQVQDAWLAIPPCSYEKYPFCHVDCPYFYECNPEYYDEENE